MEKMILEVKEVSAVRKKFRLQNISFSLPEGYIMGLMGKNGAGKTTLLKCIANGKSRYQGDILVAGKNCHSNPLWTGNKIAYLTEESRFFHEETLERNAKVFGLFYENFSLEEWKRYSQAYHQNQYHVMHLSQILLRHLDYKIHRYYP